MDVIHYKHNKEAEISSNLLTRIQKFDIQSLTIDYSRKDDRIFKTVYFRVFVTGTATSKENIVLLDLSDANREDIINMIVFTRKYCLDNKLKFDNKFALDGYTYNNRTISREIKKAK